VILLVVAISVGFAYAAAPCTGRGPRDSHERLSDDECWRA
jgi:hypothetical protein